MTSMRAMMDAASMLCEANNHWISDAAGQPLTVYHGTTLRRITDISDGAVDHITTFDAETYFAASKQEAESYASGSGERQVYAANIWMNQPFRTNDYDTFAEIVHNIPELQKQGYDGAIYGDDDQFVVFSPAQIRLLGFTRQ